MQCIVCRKRALMPRNSRRPTAGKKNMTHRSWSVVKNEMQCITTYDDDDDDHVT